MNGNHLWITRHNAGDRTLCQLKPNTGKNDISNSNSINLYSRKPLSYVFIAELSNADMKIIKSKIILQCDIKLHHININFCYNNKTYIFGYKPSSLGLPALV